MRSLIRSVTREVGDSQTGTSSGLTRSVNSRTLGVSLTRSIQVAYERASEVRSPLFWVTISSPSRPW